MSTDLSTPPQRRRLAARWLWKTWFSAGKRSALEELTRLILAPLGLLGCWAGQNRLRAQLQAPALPIPVIAVGNTLIGGAGKTPACIGILEGLRDCGLQVGLVSRGYGASPALRAHGAPRVVLPGETTTAGWVGDEAFLFHQRLGTPIGVHPDRHRAGMALLARSPGLQALVLDDGLSQTSLRPAVRVLVLDERLRGNGLCLPAGPNRFPWPPLPEAAPDLLLVRGAPSPEDLEGLLRLLPRRPETAPLPMQPECWMHQTRPLSQLQLAERIRASSRPVVWALAGIAEPSRFFDLIRSLGLPLSACLALDDHALEPWGALRRALQDAPWPDFILTTEKDFGKFDAAGRDLPQDRVFALRLGHPLEGQWIQTLVGRLQSQHGL